MTNSSFYYKTVGPVKKDTSEGVSVFERIPLLFLLFLPWPFAAATPAMTLSSSGCISMLEKRLPHASVSGGLSGLLRFQTRRLPCASLLCPSKQTGPREWKSSHQGVTFCQQQGMCPSANENTAVMFGLLKSHSQVHGESGLHPTMHATWYSKGIKKTQDHFAYELEGIGHFLSMWYDMTMQITQWLAQTGTLPLSKVCELLKERGL